MAKFCKKALVDIWKQAPERMDVRKALAGRVVVRKAEVRNTLGLEHRVVGTLERKDSPIGVQMRKDFPIQVRKDHSSGCQNIRHRSMRQRTGIGTIQTFPFFFAL